MELYRKLDRKKSQFDKETWEMSLQMLEKIAITDTKVQGVIIQWSGFPA